MDNIWGSVSQYTQVAWDWPIALDLFLAAVSAGALITALLVKGMRANTEDGVVKAGAIIAPVTVMIGLAILVVHLGKPLSFYLLPLNPHFGSVMSLGVMLYGIYTPLVLVFTAIVFKKALGEISLVKPFLPIIEIFERMGAAFEKLLVVLAIAVPLYTGFLLSALVAKPLLNSPMLPLLFLVSGLAAGAAANILGALLFFRNNVADINLQFTLDFSTRIILFKGLLLFLFFAGLYMRGGEAAVIAGDALTSGTWAMVFWVGVVAIGCIVPAMIGLRTLNNYGFIPATANAVRTDTAAASYVRFASPGTAIVNACLVLAGAFLLRLYVLYAGQIFLG